MILRVNRELIAIHHMKKEPTIFVTYFYKYCALLDICNKSWFKVINLFIYLSIESVNFQTLSTHVPTCLSCLRGHVSTCLACLCAYVPKCLACLFAHVPTYLACVRADLHAQLPKYFVRFACSLTNVPCELLRACVLTCYYYK